MASFLPKDKQGHPSEYYHEYVTPHSAQQEDGIEQLENSKLWKQHKHKHQKH